MPDNHMEVEILKPRFVGQHPDKIGRVFINGTEVYSVHSAGGADIESADKNINGKQMVTISFMLPKENVKVVEIICAE